MREQRYKHTHDNKKKPFSYSEEIQYLKDMEKNGWELVSVINQQDLNIYPIIYYWKKRIKHESYDAGAL